jgi:hypothetical protein
MSTATVVDPVEQAQIEDERKLTANGQKIDKIMGFLFDGVNRREAGRMVTMVEEAEANAAVPREGKVFHHYKGKRVGIAHNASNLMHLNAALELQWETMLHGEDLHKALHMLLVNRGKLLKRILERRWKFK